MPRKRIETNALAPPLSPDDFYNFHTRHESPEFRGFASPHIIAEGIRSPGPKSNTSHVLSPHDFCQLRNGKAIIKPSRMLTRQFDALVSPRYSGQFVSPNRCVPNKKKAKPKKNFEQQASTGLKELQLDSGYFLRSRNKVNSREKTIKMTKAELSRNRPLKSVNLSRNNSSTLRSTTKDPGASARPITRAQGILIGVQHNRECNDEDKSKILSKSTIAGINKDRQPKQNTVDKSKTSSKSSKPYESGKNSNMIANRSNDGEPHIRVEESMKIINYLRFHDGKTTREVSLTMSHSVQITMEQIPKYQK